MLKNARPPLRGLRWRPWLAAAMALLAGLAGYYGPWVPHRAAGLVVVGLDLAEYAKFLPEVAGGQIGLYRELFYLPLLAASLAFGLIASRRSLPAWARLVLAAAAVPVALAMLPPAWTPATLRSQEYRVQVAAIAFCVLSVVPGIALTRLLPDRVVLLTIAILAVGAALYPTIAFLQMRPAIEAVYRASLPPGWGVYVCCAGYALSATLSAVLAWSNLMPGPSAWGRSASSGQ